MPAGIWFWIIYVICAIFGMFFNWPAEPGTPWSWRPFGWSIVLLILIGLLGWGIFGPPIR